MMGWKKFGFYLALIFLVSVGLSVITRYALIHQAKETSWSKMLSLTPEQEKKFSAMESEFNLLLKQITVEDAQNKVSLCAYLHSAKMGPKDMEKMTHKMAGLYEQKQKQLPQHSLLFPACLLPSREKHFPQN